MKDWCTWFPEYVHVFIGFLKTKKVYIGDCCKLHDYTCSTKRFYVCLVRKVGRTWANIITTGGALGCWVKQTKYMFKKAFRWLYDYSR